MTYHTVTLEIVGKTDKTFHNVKKIHISNQEELKR